MVKQNLPYLDSGHKELDDAIVKSPQPKDISEMASYDTHDGCFFRCLFLGKIVSYSDNFLVQKLSRFQLDVFMMST